MPRTTSDPTVRLARRPVGALLRIPILALLLACVAAPGAAGAAVSLGGWMAHSPDDISGLHDAHRQRRDGERHAAVHLHGRGHELHDARALDQRLDRVRRQHVAGNSDPTNDCLPTAAHTNPFLAVYWDDLQPVRHERPLRHRRQRARTASSSPTSRSTSIAGVEGQDDLRFQVQLHERSNTITVRYRDTAERRERPGGDHRLPGRRRRRRRRPSSRSAATARSSTTTAPTRAGRPTSAAPARSRSRR